MSSLVFLVPGNRILAMCLGSFGGLGASFPSCMFGWFLTLFQGLKHTKSAVKRKSSWSAFLKMKRLCKLMCTLLLLRMIRKPPHSKLFHLFCPPQTIETLVLSIKISDLGTSPLYHFKQQISLFCQRASETYKSMYS